MTTTPITPDTATRGADALRADLQRSFDFSWNYANAKPDIGETEKMHILGLCRMLKLAISALATPVQATAPRDGEADDLCPNCVNPWKCSGPHVGLAPPAAQASDTKQCRDCFGHGVLLDADIPCPRCNETGVEP